MGRKAKKSDIDALKTMSREYAKLTRMQAFLYYQDAGSSERFIFRNESKMGIENALDYMLDLLNEAKK